MKAGETGAAAALGGKVAVVTYAARGVGRAIAQVLAAEGAAVVCVLGEHVANEIRVGGGRAISCDYDVSEMDGGSKVIDLARSEFGRLDVLVNTAAGLDPADDLTPGGGIIDMSPEDFYASVRRGLKATFTPTRHAAAVFRKQRSGRIVNITSDDGLGIPGSAERAMVSEGKYGVTCNAVVADDPAAAAALTASLCTDALANVNGRTLGARHGSIFLYEEPAIVAGVHRWGGLNLDELDSLVPRLLAPAQGQEPA